MLFRAWQRALRPGNGACVLAGAGCFGSQRSLFGRWRDMKVGHWFVFCNHCLNFTRESMHSVVAKTRGAPVLVVFSSFFAELFLILGLVFAKTAKWFYEKCCSKPIEMAFSA